ncbi:nitroreductase family protein [Anaeromicropila herbilytica]|uniref:Nitroreductase n=1 Tax=Anaeromicropila herbilytica TaxID=2785025 RepID=A0A7R7IE60_9FIRM|nr:nitroreductase family protein [Anaeromicropila herbilytica]BCN31774.1 nitroreductase [Anaeromicropila herbilytica]
MEAIFNRRSIRKYQDRPVEKEKIEKLLRAAMQAPSAANQQPWEYIVVEEKETLQKLADMCPYSKMTASAAVAFVAVANRDTIRFETAWQQDMGASVENLLLEATDLDLGAVWLGVATAEANAKYISELFGLPENIMPFALIPVGYPDGQENTFVDRYDSKKVHNEKW